MTAMKRMTAAMFAAMTLMTSASMMTACAETTAAEQPTAMIGMANPWVEMDSVEELNAAAEMHLQLPGVMGVSDVHYRLMNAGEYPLAEITFTVNGIPYTLRGSADCENDISGVYLKNGRSAFEGFGGGANVATETMKLARWFNTDGQVVLVVEDNGKLDPETFCNIVDEMTALTNPFQPVQLADGTYFDSVSQRASAEVKNLGSDTYAIEIHWADSAFDDNVWTMTATMVEDGTMVYDDCVARHVTTNENGTETVTEANLIPEGYFMVYQNGSFDWSGAAEEACRECVFEYAN